MIDGSSELSAVETYDEAAYPAGRRMLAWSDRLVDRVAPFVRRFGVGPLWLLWLGGEPIVDDGSPQRVEGSRLQRWFGSASTGAGARARTARLRRRLRLTVRRSSRYSHRRGALPLTLTVRTLLDAPLPVDWSAQAALFGIALASHCSQFLGPSRLAAE